MLPKRRFYSFDLVANTQNPEPAHALPPAAGQHFDGGCHRVGELV
jgi:hypothetical protein